MFDRSEADNWDSCAKIYKTYQTIDEIRSNKSNNLLNLEKLEMLKGVVAKDSKKNKMTTYETKVELLEYWGDIELPNGEVLKNKLNI